MCCIGFGPSDDVLQELLEVEQCWRRLEDEETNVVTVDVKATYAYHL